MILIESSILWVENYSQSVPDNLINQTSIHCTCIFQNSNYPMVSKARSLSSKCRLQICQSMSSGTLFTRFLGHFTLQSPERIGISRFDYFNFYTKYLNSSSRGYQIEHEFKYKTWSRFDVYPQGMQ